MPLAAPKPLPFDTIELRTDDEQRVLTPDELIAMPLQERVHLLIEGQLRFVREGKRVDSQIAMRAVYQRARRTTGTMRIVKAPDESSGT